MNAKPAWGRGSLSVLIGVVYASFVLGFWGEYLKLSIVTNVFLAIWVVFKHLDLKKEVFRADSEKFRADQIGEALRDRIGYQVGKLEIQVDIANYDGDCITRWIWTGIKNAHPGSPLSSIPGRMDFSPQESSFSTFPTLMPGYDGKYEIEFLRRDTDFCVFQVRVKEITNEIGFGYTASINRAFTMTEEEMAGQPYKYEYFGFRVEGAIENLIIKVAFPDHYKPDSIQPDVCIGELVPTDVSDNTEIDRILSSGGFRNEWGEASITVKKPRMGSLYFLRWRPLPKVVVEVMKQRKTLGD